MSRVDGSNVRRRRFLDGRERAFWDGNGWVDLPPSVAADLASTAAVYRRESELLHGSWLIAGTLDGRRVSMPVLCHSLRPESLAGATFQLDPDDWRLNPALDVLAGFPPDLEDELRERWAGRFPGPGGMDDLIARLGEEVPGLDLRPAAAYPALAGAGEIEASSRRPGLRLHPAAVLLLADRSPRVRGVLDETRRLAEPGCPPSPPLRRLLGEEVPGEVDRKRPSPAPRAARLPFLATEAQEALLESAASEPLTLCHGPPGTGKTLTLAAAAVEHAMRGQAVLIACASGQAADVVEAAVAGLVGSSNLVLRAGGRAGIETIARRLDALPTTGPEACRQEAAAMARREDDLRRALDLAARRSRGFDRQLRRELAAGRLFDGGGPGGRPWGGLRRWLHAAGMSRRPLLMDAACELEHLEGERVRLAREHLRACAARWQAEALRQPGVAATLRRYRDALRRRTGTAREAALDGVERRALHAWFPIWVVEADQLHRLLPLEAGAFPLVIVDEATQCDLASALPLLQRGCRALVCGDPRQLRHVSFLSESRIASLAARYGEALPEERWRRHHFRRVSLVDLALERASARHFLATHFRSRPELIRFSNQRFYDGRLHLMKERPAPAEAAPATAEIFRVAGTRDRSGVNHAELEAAVDWLERHLASEDRPAESLGFLSPLRAQVDALLPLLRRRLGSAALRRLVERHGFIAATAHGFQGAERDVMLISLGIGPDCPAGARRFIEREDVFNVSITRARDRVVVLCSLPQAGGNAGLAADWLASLEAPDAAGPRERRGDDFAREVAAALESQGAEVRAAASAAGVPLDLWVSGPRHGGLAIDLVGQRGEAGDEVALRRNLLLRRCGLRLHPLGLAEWRVDRGRCLHAILRRLAGDPEAR